MRTRSLVSLAAFVVVGLARAAFAAPPDMTHHYIDLHYAPYSQTPTTVDRILEFGAATGVGTYNGLLMINGTDPNPVSVIITITEPTPGFFHMNVKPAVFAFFAETLDGTLSVDNPAPYPDFFTGDLSWSGLRRGVGGRLVQYVAHRPFAGEGYWSFIQ
jgi:hypothetical protein